MHTYIPTLSVVLGLDLDPGGDLDLVGVLGLHDSGLKGQMISEQKHCVSNQSFIQMGRYRPLPMGCIQFIKWPGAGPPADKMW